MSDVLDHGTPDEAPAPAGPPPAPSFVHLHVHTQYSIADASTRVKDLCETAAAMGMPAVALTDHENLYGAVHFAKECAAHNLKPIYGCAMRIASRPMGEHVLRSHQLNLLAINQVGYRNLLEIVSQANLQAPTGAPPRVSHDYLQGRCEGLIALTGNLSGEVPNALLRGQRREAERHLRRLIELFGEQNVYVEVQLTSLPEHQRLAPLLVELAEQVGVPAVASNDVHYLKREHARAHEVLVAIGLGIQARADADWLPTSDYCFASPQEMRARFAALGLESLCDRTQEIADRVDFTLPLGKTFLPRYKVPDEFTIPEYFAHVSREGLERRLDEARRNGRALDEEAYRARLEVEIDVIIKMDFPGYFLIVWDFIDWAKRQDISVGPGRGSGAGSLVAWSLRITDIDPIPYHLLFERFLNPERVSMPDFDIDFCVKRRGEVIDYVSAKYGHDHVSQIVTFGTLKAKGAIRDCGRVLGIDLAKVNELAKLVPDDPKLKDLAEARAREPRIDEMANADPELRNLLQTAEELEGSARQTGMHAAGIVISEEVLWHYVPVAKGVNGENVTMFAKDEVEKAGLVKFDFLGLKNLTMITNCVELVNQGRAEGDKLDLSAIPLDDQDAFAVLARGETAGIFQCESTGFTQMLKDLKPTEFEDLIASGALYRPGPLGMQMHTRYIERKHRREEVEVLHECIEPVLRETYGVIVYQEQVMQIAREMAGYSLGGADILRRAMGKKKKEEMDKQRAIFLEGADKRGIPAETANKVFNLMESFADYGFNKSHSAAYGLITYQTAWLKAHHKTEFFAALLTSDSSDTGKVVQYIQEARRAGLEVLPPDVNHSQMSFSVANGAIRFGLGAVKNVGEAAIDATIAARASGPFTSLFDLCLRVGSKVLNRRVLEQLVKCGALDSFGVSRETLWANLGKALDRATEEARAREVGQGSLFGGLLGGGKVELQDAYAPATERWTLRQMLGFEKECLGFYVTGHPLDRYKAKLFQLSVHSLVAAKSKEIRKLADRRGRVSIQVAAMVVSFRERILGAGKRMGVVMLEDLSGQAEVTLFDGSIDAVRGLLSRNEPLLLKLSVSPDRKDEAVNRLIIDSGELLDERMQQLTDHLRVELTPESCGQQTLHALVDLLHQANRLAESGEPWPTEPTEGRSGTKASAHEEAAPAAVQLDVFIDAAALIAAPAAGTAVDAANGARPEADAEIDIGAEAETGAETDADSDDVEDDSYVERFDLDETVPLGGLDGPTLAALAGGAKAMVPVQIVVTIPGEGRVTVAPRRELRVNPSDTLVGKIERLVGRGAVRLS